LRVIDLYVISIQHSNKENGNNRESTSATPIYFLTLGSASAKRKGFIFVHECVAHHGEGSWSTTEIDNVVFSLFLQVWRDIFLGVSLAFVYDDAWAGGR
jgi:hypothetical protein